MKTLNSILRGLLNIFVYKIASPLGFDFSEILGFGYDFKYRWFHFRELIGFPSYANGDKQKSLYMAKLILIGKTFG